MISWWLNKVCQHHRWLSSDEASKWLSRLTDNRSNQLPGQWLADFFFVSLWPSSCQEWCRYPAGALTTVRSGAEIGFLSLRLSVSQGASLGDFLLAPPCPVEKVTLWEGFLYLTSGSEADEGVATDKVFVRTGNRTRDSETLSTRLSLRYHRLIDDDRPYLCQIHCHRATYPSLTAQWLVSQYNY